MKVLVTGATGFIGRHLVPCLIRLGHTVVASGRSSSRASRCDWLVDVEFVPFDILSDRVPAMADFGHPDILIHLAWEGLSDFNSSLHTDELLPAHSRFLDQLINSGLSQCVVLGTCLEYGKTEGALRESMRANPGTAYARGKNALHEHLLELQNRHAFALRWIRLFYVHGVGQSQKALLSQLDQTLARGDEFFPMSPGDQLRDYLPVERAAELIAGISLRTDYSGVVNCCSGDPVTVQQLVEAHLAKRDASIPLRLGTFPYPDYEARNFWGDTTRLNALVKGEPAS